MAHVIPTIRGASRPVYIMPATRRITTTPASTRNPAATSAFGSILNDQSTPAAATTATPPASPSGTIGTVTPWSASTAVVAPAASACPMAPTAQSLFGSSPWESDAGGSGPMGSYNYNQYYFATPATAAKVAQMLGGTVVQMNAITPNGPFKQNEPNQMIQMPDGRMINAGLVASFYDHGYTQQMVDKMIAAEVTGNTMYS